jgi:hypothetical protein
VPENPVTAPLGAVFFQLPFTRSRGMNRSHRDQRLDIRTVKSQRGQHLVTPQLSLSGQSVDRVFIQTGHSRGLVHVNQLPITGTHLCALNIKAPGGAVIFKRTLLLRYIK